MPLPVGYYTRINIVGHLKGGEIFNWGLWAQHNALQTQTDLNTMASAVAALITATSFATIRSLIDSGEGYDKVRLYHYAPAVSQNAKVVAESNITSVVGSGTTYHPLQSAIVMTLNTGVPGRANRGRAYLPATSVALGTDHQIGSSSLQTVADEFKTFVNAINALTNVLSCVVVSKVGSGNTNVITQIVADTRLDTQRRRANKETVTARVTSTVTP